MIRRTFDPAFLNEVINHPEVRPWMEGEGVLDLAVLAYNPANYVLQSEFGGFVLVCHEPGRYEVHSQFLPGHGTHPAKAMRCAQEYMFTRTDCEAVISKVPDGNTRAKGFAVTGGLRPIFRGVAAEFVELTLMDWAMRTKGIEVHGERFHAFVEDNKPENWPDHPHDPAHERAVGAALLMFERGQSVKGVAFYNRWARQAGYPVVQLLSASPVAVNMSAGEAVLILGIGEQGLEILLCR